MRKLWTLGLFMLFSLIVAPSVAHALTVTQCTVKNFGWQGVLNNAPNPGRILWINCTDSTVYLAYTSSNTNAANCNTDLDSLKIMQSLAAEAMLSGQPLTMYWSQQTCQNGSSRIFSSVQVGQP